MFNKADVCELEIYCRRAPNHFSKAKTRFCIRADRENDFIGQNCHKAVWKRINGRKREKQEEKGENTKQRAFLPNGRRENERRREKRKAGFLPNGRRENDRGEEREAESGGSFYRREKENERGEEREAESGGVFTDGEGKDERGERGRGAERAEEGEGEIEEGVHR